jgi:hypothetical protein
MEASQHTFLAACITLHSINATLAIVPQRGAGLWNWLTLYLCSLIKRILQKSDLNGYTASKFTMVKLLS